MRKPSRAHLTRYAVDVRTVKNEFLGYAGDTEALSSLSLTIRGGFANGLERVFRIRGEYKSLLEPLSDDSRWMRERSRTSFYHTR